MRLALRLLPFARLDVSNTGYISAEDLKVVMGEDYEEEAVKKMMAVGGRVVGAVGARFLFPRRLECTICIDSQTRDGDEDGDVACDGRGLEGWG